MPLESIWVQFFKMDAKAASAQISWDDIFSVYIHPHPDHRFPASSFFAGHEIIDRVNVQWGRHSMIEAERLLLRAALQDPLNSHFVLLCETSIPLYSAPATYLQIVSESRSRINSCSVEPENMYHIHATHRWMPEFEAVGLPVALWRKSSQWMSLIRKHAQLVVDETEINAVFSEICWMSFEPEDFRTCVSDEHYIASLLAVRGLEEECACDGVSTRAVWEGNYAHPRTFKPEEATYDTLRETLRMEGDCPQGKSLEKESDLVMTGLLHAKLQAWSSMPLLVDSALNESGIERMRPRCPLFARKIDAEGNDNWMELLSPILG